MSLLKGFIRSAVNQVGRDGGRVISNSVYGNAHSAPVSINHESGETGHSNQNSATAHLIKDKEYVAVKLFWCAIISWIIPMGGGLFFIYWGIATITAKTMKMYSVTSRPAYVADRRYASGQRPVGNKQVRTEVKVEVDEEQKHRNKLKGIGYILIGALGFYTWANMWFIK